MADLAGKKVAILVDNYFEQSEMTGPRDALIEVGATVDLISTKERTVQGMNHAEMADTFDVDGVVGEVTTSDYDALVIPGGTINGDQLRVNKAAQTWVTEFNDSNKPMAIICHGPWILINAGIIEGKTVTSYSTLQMDLENAGAEEWRDEEVVIDGNLITSRKPDDIQAFTSALIDMLEMDDAPEEEL